MISFAVTGDFKSIGDFLQHVKKLDILGLLESYGEMGVAALSSATPKDSGLAAGAWGYHVKADKGVYAIAWTNTDVESDFPVVIMLQYGYSTGTGGYVQGRDYINPTMKPIFDLIADKVWKAVTST